MLMVRLAMVSKCGYSKNARLTSPGSKKKRKRNKKKNKKISEVKQSTPPRVALAEIFRDQVYPEGEKFDYEIEDENLKRTTAEELRHLAAVTNMDDDFLRDYRKAAEIHRQVRQYAQTIAKPGISMTEIAREIDDGVRALTGHQGLEKGDGLKAGLAFRTILVHTGRPIPVLKKSSYSMTMS
jgi:methionyl aminopeptidase